MLLQVSKPKPHAGVEPAVKHIGQQVNEDKNKSGEQHGAHNEGEIEFVERIDGEFTLHPSIRRCIPQRRTLPSSSASQPEMAVMTGLRALGRACPKMTLVVDRPLAYAVRI